LKKINKTFRADGEDSVIMAEHPEQAFLDISISLNELRLIKKILDIILVFFRTSKKDMIEIDKKKNHELTFCLQRLAKIPMNYYKFLVYSHEHWVAGKSATLLAEDRAKNDSNFLKPEVLFDPILGDIFKCHLYYDVFRYENEKKYILYENKLFDLAHSLIELIVNFSVNTTLVVSMARTGLIWRCMQWFTMYRETRELNIDITYKGLLKEFNKLARRAGLAARNAGIYANEAYILELTNEKSRVRPGGGFGGFLTNKEKSTMPMNEIAKLDEGQVESLLHLYEGMLTLLGRRLYQLILEDYFEPIIKEEPKDQASVDKVLVSVNSVIYEPNLLWTKETQEDYRNLLILQLRTINEDHSPDPTESPGMKRGRWDFISKIRGYVYATHLNDVIVDDIHVHSPQHFIIPPFSCSR
jgi:hypothetical protein